MRENKYFFTFFGLFASLSISYVIVLAKYIPILIHQTIYFCREMTKDIFLNIPEGLKDIVFGALLFLLGYALLRFIGTFTRTYSFQKSVQRSITTDIDISKSIRKLDLIDKVIVIHNSKPFAYCFGIRAPKIYISTGLIAMVDVKELMVILRHEKYHLEHRDNLILVLAIFIESLFPFFPILKDLTRIYKIDRELLADRAAITNPMDKLRLTSVLRKLLEYEPTLTPVIVTALAQYDTLEVRIKSLLAIQTKHETLHKRNLIISIFSLALLIGLLATPVSAIEFHKDGLDVLIVCNENASCESVCNDKKIHLVAPLYSSINHPHSHH